MELTHSFKPTSTPVLDRLRRAFSFKNLLIPALCVLGLSSSFKSSAQLHESIEVEGKYVPEVIHADRINILPEEVAFEVEKPDMQYEEEGVEASFAPTVYTMAATGWKATRKVSRWRGYIEGGLGSWLTSTLSAGYRIIDDEKTLLGIRFQHNSTSLWKPSLSEATADVRKWRYDEAVGIYFSHLAGAGRINASIDYNYGNFNYYGIFNPSSLFSEKVTAPEQTLNDFAMNLEWRSASSATLSPDYGIRASLRHLSFKHFILPMPWETPEVKSNPETEFKVSGHIQLPWENGSSIGLDATLDLLFYSGPESLAGFLFENPPLGVALEKPENYGILTLTPFYRFTKGLFDINIGADIDLSFKAGPEGKRYPFFHIAPDVRLGLRKNFFGLSLELAGGTRANTLAYLRQLDYYSMPVLTTTRPSYIPLDATLGFNFGAFHGFSVSLLARYKFERNVSLGGWYQAWLDYGNRLMPGLTTHSGISSSDILYSLDSEGINLHGGSLSAILSYELSERVKFSARGDWQPQKGNLGFFNGYDRPRVTARFELSGSPIEPLRLTLGYNYRGVRKIYTREVFGKITSGSILPENVEPVLMNLRLPDITLLDFSASWAFTPSFSVWVQADNLLNRHDAILPMLPQEGVTVTGGLMFLF